MVVVRVQKCQAFHHPRVQAIAAVARDFTHDVPAIAQPLQLAACCRRKDCEAAILAAIAVLSYVFAIESEMRLIVV